MGTRGARNLETPAVANTIRRSVFRCMLLPPHGGDGRSKKRRSVEGMGGTTKSGKSTAPFY